jgi:hypothetical protein
LPDLQSQVVRLDRSRDVGLVLHDELAVHRQYILGQRLQRRRVVLGRQERRLPGQEPARPVEAELRDQDVLADGQLQEPGERDHQLITALRREERREADEREIAYGSGVSVLLAVARTWRKQPGMIERCVQPLSGRCADHDQFGDRCLDQPA